MNRSPASTSVPLPTSADRLPVKPAGPASQPIWACALLALSLGGCAQMEGINPLGQPLKSWVAGALGGGPAAAPGAATTTAVAPSAADASVRAPQAGGRPRAGEQIGQVPGHRDELAELAPRDKAGRRFSLVLNGATPETVFMSLLAETPLSVAVEPGVKGPMAINLKDVTLREALDLLRELHNLEYKIIGRHIIVSPATMQTRIFTIDYPSFNRVGRSDSRVVSGSITGASGGGGSGGGNGSGGSGGGSGSNGGGSSSGGASGNSSSEGSRITTSQRNDLWQEVETTIKLLVGDKEGRSVIVSPQTGNIVVRAFPRELRTVQEFLTSTRASIERQVMLEAKVVEVQLRDSERTGINWAAFKNGLSLQASGGIAAPGVALTPSGGALAGSSINVITGKAIGAAATNAGAVLGLAFQTSNFASVLEFLGTQGNTQVLSSPRIATMNNQKALLKVGTDDFFVTSISTTTQSTGNTSSTSPNIGVQPFFSGISLDVTPSITADGFITLHVHPTVSTVSERNKVLNLGTLGTYSLPLASSDINETDAVVRARDGQIIAIGGLMRMASVKSDSGMPGAQGTFLRKLLGGETHQLSEKRELVVLLKPTIIDPNADNPGAADSLQRLLDWTEKQASVRR